MLNVSRQRLSLCGPAIADSKPWIGHSRKLRRRRQINQHRVQELDDSDTTAKSPVPPVSTRSGREVKRPSRFNLVNSPEVCSLKTGEVVRRQSEQGSPEFSGITRQAHCLTNSSLRSIVVYV